MLPGFNHNVRHGGKTFHVQTEDHGTANPVVVTELFCGGNVLETIRTEYRSLVNLRDLPQRVRGIMEDQHKAMLRKVASGAFDEGQVG